MSKKKHHHEEHVDESWLIPYADILTLLLALFIVLFAQSSTDSAKFKQMADAFNQIFNGTSGIMENTSLGVQSAVRQPLSEAEKSMMKAVAEENDLKKVKEAIDSKIKEEGLEDQVSTDLSKEGLKITLTDEVVFHSGDATLKMTHIDLINAITSLVVDLPNPVQINGFTDNVPISTAKYPSNWELSAARGLSVLKYMLGYNAYLNPIRFSTSGFGENKPVADNSTVEGREKNRRVEIVIRRVNGDGLLIPNDGGEIVEEGNN